MIDFDSFRAEQKAARKQSTGPAVKVGGEVYHLPPSLPAMVALDILRARRELGDDADVAPDMVNDIGDALFGEDTFRTLIRVNNLTLDDLAALIRLCLEKYNEAQPPNRETRRKEPRSRSSTTGQSSRRISSGSTGSSSRTR